MRKWGQPNLPQLGPQRPKQTTGSHSQQTVLLADGGGLFIFLNGLEHQRGHPLNILYIRWLMVHFRT